MPLVAIRCQANTDTRIGVGLIVRSCLGVDKICRDLTTTPTHERTSYASLPCAPWPSQWSGAAMSRAIYALRVRHTPEGIRLPERDYRHDVWSLIQAAAVRVTYRAPLDGWEPYTAVYEVEDTQGWTTLYAVQAAPGPGSPPLDESPPGTRPGCGHRPQWACGCGATSGLCVLCTR